MIKIENNITKNKKINIPTRLPQASKTTTKKIIGTGNEQLQMEEVSFSLFGPSKQDGIDLIEENGIVGYSKDDIKSVKKEETRTDEYTIVTLKNGLVLKFNLSGDLVNIATDTDSFDIGNINNILPEEYTGSHQIDSFYTTNGRLGIKLTNGVFFEMEIFDSSNKIYSIADDRGTFIINGSPQSYLRNMFNFVTNSDNQNSTQVTGIDMHNGLLVIEIENGLKLEISSDEKVENLIFSDGNTLNVKNNNVIQQILKNGYQQSDNVERNREAVIKSIYNDGNNIIITTDGADETNKYTFNMDGNLISINALGTSVTTDEMWQYIVDSGQFGGYSISTDYYIDYYGEVRFFATDSNGNKKTCYFNLAYYNQATKPTFEIIDYNPFDFQSN